MICRGVGGLRFFLINIMIVLLPKISDSVLLYLVTRMLHLFIYKTLKFFPSRAGAPRLTTATSSAWHHSPTVLYTVSILCIYFIVS